MCRGKYLRACALVLFAAGCRSKTPDYAKELQSAEPAVRLRAVHGLQKRMKDAPTAVPLLIDALGDADTFVRRDAAMALGHFGMEAKEAVPTLQALKRDKEPGVRKAADEALMRIDPSAIPIKKVR